MLRRRIAAAAALLLLGLALSGATTQTHTLAGAIRSEQGWTSTDASSTYTLPLQDGYQAIAHVETAAGSGVTIDVQAQVTGDSGEDWRSVLTSTIALGASTGRHVVVDYGYRAVRVVCTGGSGTYEVHLAAVRRGR